MRIPIPIRGRCREQTRGGEEAAAAALPAVSAAFHTCSPRFSFASLRFSSHRRSGPRLHLRPVSAPGNVTRSLAHVPADPSLPQISDPPAGS